MDGVGTPPKRAFGELGGSSPEIQYAILLYKKTVPTQSVAGGRSCLRAAYKYVRGSATETTSILGGLYALWRKLFSRRSLQLKQKREMSLG
jgi:hypothetical protein